ncbi:MAG: hypothetical protein ACP5VQ_07650 [Phycisphaerae bacterium]
MRKVMPVALAIGFVVVFIWLLASVAWTTSRGAAQMPLYSAYRFDPYGSAALEQFLQASGHKVTLLTHPILPDNAAGVLINVTPPYKSGMLENYSTGKHYNPQLLRWIASGNTLIDFTQNPTGLTDHFKIHVVGLIGLPRSDKHRHQGKKLAKKKRGEHQRKPRHHRMRMPGIFPKWLTVMRKGDNPRQLQRWIHNVPWNYYATAATPWPVPRRTIQVLAPAYLMVPKKDKHWRILAQRKSGPVAIERSLGKGRVVLIGSPWPMLNGGIARAGNLEFLRTIIGNKPVILDQWSLGIGHNYTTLDILRRYGLLPALLELILLFIAYAWSCRGYPSEKCSASKTMTRSSMEHIAMLGRLYESALSEPEIFQRVKQEILHRMAMAMRCRPDQIAEKIRKQPDAIGQAWSLLAVRLQTVERNMRESPGGFKRRKAAGHRLLADLLTQSWQLAKEIHHGGHTNPQTAGNHRRAERGAGGNKKGDSRAGIAH